MKHELVYARDLTPGMVIVPPIRTMRHATVESLKFADGDGVSKGVGVPRDMRNHKASYVVVNTDIGPKSFRSDQGVSVMVSSS